MIERLKGRAKDSGRTDDNMETLEKRYHTYINDTLPIVKIYEDLGKTVKVYSLIYYIIIYYITIL